MSATIGAAAITAGAGLLGSLFGSKKQDKNAQAQRDWQEKMYLMDRDYNTAANQRKRFEEAGLNPNLMMNGSAGSVSGSVPSTSMSNSGETLAQGISSAGSSAAQMIAQQMDINAQKNVRAAEARNADEQADYTGQMTEAQRMQNMFLLQILQSKTKNLQLRNVYQELENKYAKDSLGHIILNFSKSRQNTIHKRLRKSHIRQSIKQRNIRMDRNTIVTKIML
jgi:hypothetical protein